MQDDNFSDYQALRAAIEKDIRTKIGGWALGEAPDDMTLNQIRSLADDVVVMMNRASLQCWELGKKNAEPKPEK